MAKFITGEQFKEGVTQVADKLNRKINDLPPAIIEQHYDVNTANILSGDIRSKDRYLVALYDFDKYDGEPYIPDELNNINPTYNMVAPPPIELDDTLGRKVAIFDGQKKYIPLAQAVKTPHTTIAILMYKDDWSAVATERIMSCTETGGYSINIGTDRILSCMMYINGGYKYCKDTTPLSNLTPGWHTIIISFDGFDMNMYIDTKLRATTPFSERTIIKYNSSNTVFINAESVTSATKPTVDSEQLLAKLAELRFYSRGLNKQEIREVHDEMMNHTPLHVSSAVNVEQYHFHIDEMSNPLALNPLEYGGFSMSERQTEDFNIGDPIKFDTMDEGNMDVEAHKIKLYAYKTYNIKMSLVIQTDRCEVQLKNTTTDEFIGKKLICVPPTSELGFSPLSHIDFYYTPDYDCEISAIITDTENTTTIFNEYATLSVHEVRNNPVNQYGGFETVVLFDGEISAPGEYYIGDSFDNYNVLLFEQSGDSFIDITPTMKSNTTPVPHVAFCKNRYESSYDAYKAFNKKNSTNTDSWLTRDITDGSWVGLDFGYIVTVSHIMIAGPAAYSSGADNAAPKKFIIQGSNVDDVWDDIISVDNQTDWKAKEERTFSLEGVRSYRKFRILCLEPNHSTGQIGIGEISFLNKVENSVSRTDILIHPNTTIYNQNLHIEMNGNTMNIIRVDKIHKIIGVKGQLPSLLVGGVF